MSKRQTPVNLKTLAEELGLSQATVSMALGPGAAESGVSAKTRERVLRAAKELNYQPNYHARSLSRGRSYTAGVLVPAISDGYYSSLIAGIESFLLSRDYLFFATSHRFQNDLEKRLPDALIQRGVEGLIIVNTTLGDVHLPTVRIGGSVLHNNSTNVRINEERGTWLAMEYLSRKGHRDIAFFRGEPESTAAEERWNGVLRAAHALDIRVLRERTVQLSLYEGTAHGDDSMAGYTAMQTLLTRRLRFTALFAYNDATAIGAMRAMQEAGLRVPQDVSVVGFDDIPASVYVTPALTTVRQPLQRIGAIAGEVLLKRIEQEPAEQEILIEPEMIERSSVLEICKSAKFRLKSRPGRRSS